MNQTLIIPPGTNDEAAEVEPKVSPVNCTACLYFRLINKHPTPDGACHRIPPTSAFVGMRQSPLGPRGGQVPIAMSFWPSVGISDWCGEFQPKKKQAEDQQ